MRVAGVLAVLLALPAGSDGSVQTAPPGAVEIDGAKNPELIPERDAYWMLFIHMADGPRSLSRGARTSYISSSGLKQEEIEAVAQAASDYFAASLRIRAELKAFLQANPERPMPERVLKEFEHVAARELEAFEASMEQLRSTLDSEALWKLKRFVNSTVKRSMTMASGRAATGVEQDPPAAGPANSQPLPSVDPCQAGSAGTAARRSTDCEKRPPLSERDPAEWKRAQSLVRAADWREREKGFHVLAEGGCADRPALELLFELMTTERLFVDALNSKGDGPGEAYGEPYTTEFLAHTFACFKESPKPEWFRSLALSTYNPNSPFARELIGYLGGELPWLIDAARRAPKYYTRANLYSLIIWAVASNPEWPAAQRSATVKAAERGFDDSDAYVRATTGYCFAESGLPETMEILSSAKARLTKKYGRTSQAVDSVDRAIAWARKKGVK